MSTQTVILNGSFRTLNSEIPTAEAAAVSCGVVTVLGDNQEISRLIDSSTVVIDAQQRTVLPAFTDSHVHLRRASVMMASYLNFTALRPSSIADVLDMVHSRSVITPADGWIQGDSLAPSQLREKRFPDRQELDQAAPHHPVVLRGIGRHVIAANSLALQIAGIDHATVSPTGGRIERDAAGHPTGVLHAQAKLRLDATHPDTVIPAASEAERSAALRHAMGLLNSHGIACIHEMAREPNDISEYLRLRESGNLTARVRFYVRGIEAQTRLDQVVGLGLRSEFGDEWIRLGGVKFSIDGHESLHTAALYMDYPGESGNRGIVRIEPAQLNDAVAVAHGAGLQVAVHAIGQRAVDIALDAFAYARQRFPESDLQHRLEHAYLPAEPGQLERIAELGLIWSTQPSMLKTFGDAWPEVFGTERCAEALPLRRGLQLGIPIQLNSDFPNTPMNPFQTVQAAVTRRTGEGKLLGSDQCLTVEESLRYLSGAAGNTRQGRITPGFLADLIIVDRDPLKVDPNELQHIKVDMTIVGGKVVYSRT